MSKTDGLILKLVNSIRLQKLQQVAFAMAMLWLDFPLIVMVLNAVGIDGYIICNIWLTVLYVTGGMGLMIGGVYLYKLFTEFSASKKELLLKIEPLVFLALFFAWSAFCILFAEEKIIALYGYLFYQDSLFVYLFYGGFIMLGIMLVSNKKMLVYTMIAFAVTGSVLSAISLINSNFTHRLCVNTLTATDAYESVFYSTEHFAMYLAIAIMASVVGYFYVNDKALRYIFFVAFFLMTVALAFNATASAAISVLLVLIAVVFLSRNNDFLSRAAFVSFSFLLLLLLTTKLFDTDFSLNSLFVIREGESQAISTDSSSFLNAKTYLKTDLWKLSLSRIVDKGIVGIGLQNTLSSSYNIFLQIAVYSGVPGLLLYISSFLSAGHIAYNLREKMTPVVKGSLIVVICYLFTAFFGVTMFYIAPYFYVIYGVLLGSLIQLDLYGNNANCFDISAS